MTWFYNFPKFYILSYRGLRLSNLTGLSKGWYDETFAGEDANFMEMYERTCFKGETIIVVKSYKVDKTVRIK